MNKSIKINSSLIALGFSFLGLTFSEGAQSSRVKEFCRDKTNLDMAVCKKINDLGAALQSTSSKSTTGTKSTGGASCADINSFTPDQYDPIKYISVRFLFPINDNQATRSKSGYPLMPLNFSELHDGMGDRTVTAEAVARELINLANQKLASNMPQRTSGSIGGTYRVFPNNIRLVLAGVEFLTDSRNLGGDLDAFNGWFSLAYSDSLQANLSYRLNWVPSYSQTNLNIVMANTHSQYLVIGEAKLDANGRPIVTPQGYQPKIFTHALPYITAGIGEMLPNNTRAAVIQTANVWTAWQLRQNYWLDPASPGGIFQGPIPLSASVPTLLGAVANLAGLTPVGTPNNIVKVKADPSAVLNNYQCLDYPRIEVNTYCGQGSLNNIMSNNCDRNAWSPCQLQVTHHNLAMALDKILHRPCRIYQDRSFDTVIPPNTSVVWKTPHHLAGHLVLGSGARLTILCHVTMAEDAQIYGRLSQVKGLDKIIRRTCDGSTTGGGLNSGYQGGSSGGTTSGTSGGTSGGTTGGLIEE